MEFDAIGFRCFGLGTVRCAFGLVDAHRRVRVSKKAKVSPNLRRGARRLWWFSLDILPTWQIQLLSFHLLKHYRTISFGIVVKPPFLFFSVLRPLLFSSPVRINFAPHGLIPSSARFLIAAVVGGLKSNATTSHTTRLRRRTCKYVVVSGQMRHGNLRGLASYRKGRYCLV